MNGLNSDQKIADQFANSLKQLQTNWQNMTIPERTAALKSIINKTLNSAGLPTCDVRSLQLGRTSGQFDREYWRITVDSDLLNQPKLSNKDVIELGQKLYHEARHSEQFYRIAQMLASQPPNGQKRTPQEIVNELGVPLSVAQRATQSVKSTPLSPAQLQAANAWYQSMYGTGRNYRSQVFNQLDTTALAYQKAQNAYDTALVNAKKLPGAVPPQTIAQLERLSQRVDSTLKAYQKAYEAYRKLPEEADAFRVQDRVSAAFNRRQNSERSGHRADANLSLSEPPSAPSVVALDNLPPAARVVPPNGTTLNDDGRPRDSSTLVLRQLQQTYKEYADLVRPTLATGATALNLDQAIAYALSRSGYTPDQRAQVIAAGSDNIPGNRTQAHAYVQQTANWPEQRTQQPVQIAQRQQ
jgi:hypothetical protein